MRYVLIDEEQYKKLLLLSGLDKSESAEQKKQNNTNEVLDELKKTINQIDKAIQALTEKGI